MSLRSADYGKRTLSGLGPVEFLARRAADRLAAAKRFHESAGAALDLAMEAAVDDLPRLYISTTTTEEYLVNVVRLSALFLASAREALESIERAHLEADLGFREEMALEREPRRPSPRASATRVFAAMRSSCRLHPLFHKLGWCSKQLMTGVGSRP
jgi:hypothetical protein